ncbi:DinB family protein [Streptomyces cinnabarinus]|uniref:DinB family protein n=1 Tax=Streptomyces cinnabarinus TaxID=67287 RepID=A0ABY7KBL6_9ACTN|nr:DinB family protein [Streptomyces cinnabarinus]WAZ21900.1 DinB family protein [Streptomyces cinnabarinus]
MTIDDAFKNDLRQTLQDARDALLWKLDDLSEYDARRPLTPTATNLLGLVKHLTGAEALYFGTVFRRPCPAPPLWIMGAEPNADLWATPDESRERITADYRRVCAHADATIEALPLDALGELPGSGGKTLTLHRVLTHMIGETHRHVGHADIVRELIDGTTGQRRDGTNMAPGEEGWWKEHWERVERAARDVTS